MRPLNLKHAESVLAQYNDLREWVENRLISLNMRFDNDYVINLSFENGKITAHVEMYGDSEYLSLEWEELADETNETYRTAEAERKRQALEAYEARQREGAQRDVEAAERALQRAKDKVRLIQKENNE